MADLDFNIKGNNEKFIKEVEQIRSSIKSITVELKDASNESNGFTNVLKKTFDMLGGKEALKKFVSDVVRVRGEYQQLELSFSTLLQNKGEADNLMSQMMQSAAETPFSLTELAAEAKELIGYGVASEEVNDTLLRLGEIASGVGAPLEQITSLYGAVMSQGGLYVEDLNKFSASGVPILQGLADVLGVNTEKVNEMVTAGTIGFPEVQKAIENLTNEGGRFYGSMDEQSKTIVGEINNLQDAWDMMLNGIGESQEGMISGAIGGIAYLVENYEQIGKILLTLVETYGVYKAACIANIVFTQSLATTQMELGLVMVKLKKAFITLTASMNLNPWVLAATAIIGLGLAMWNLADRTTAAERAQKRFNAEQEKFNQQQEKRKQKIESLVHVIQDETETEYAKTKAYEELQKYSPALTEAYSREEIANLDLAESQKVCNEERDKIDYDHVVSKINTITGAIKQLKAENGKVVGTASGGMVMTIDNTVAIKQNENDLKIYKKQLDEHDRLKKEAEENKKPIEERIVVAKDNLEKIREEYNKVNTLMIEERAKLEKNPFYIIPLQLQLEFEGLDRGVKEAQSKVLELENQKAERTTYQKELQVAKDDWISKKKTYQGVLKNPNSTSHEVSNAKLDMDSAEKAYKALGGVTDNSAAENRAEKILAQEKRLKELLDKQARDLVGSTEEQWNKVWQAQINVMDEGSEKTLAQMEFNHEQALQAIDHEKEELLKKKIEEAEAIFNAKEDLKVTKNPNYKKATFDSSSVTLSETDNKQFDERYKAELKRQTNEREAYYNSEKQAMNEYLKEYGTYMEKRNAIIALGESKKKGKSEGEQMIIAEETKKALSDLDIEANKDKSAFGQLFSNMKDRSVKDMRAIVAEAQNMLNFVEKGKWSDSEGEVFHISKETFDVLKKSPQEIEKIKNGIEDLNEQANASDTALNKMSIGFDHLFAAGSDPGKLKKALGEIGDSMNEVLQSTKFFSDCLAGLGDAFGSDTLSGIAEGMNVAMDAASSAMSGAQAGAMFGPWGAAAGAAIGLVSSLGSSLAKLHDAKHEKSIQQIQEQIEVLEKSYENLGDSLDKAFSSDAAELIDQQNTLLEQQKVLIRNQIAEEQSKKKSDQGRIDEWEKQIEDIDKVIAGNKEKKIDVIFGEDLKAAIENFAQAYAEAWSAGDDKAKSSKELVKNMIKQMITEAIKAASSKPMEALRQRLANFFSDGIISDWERQQIEKDAEAIANDLDRQFSWADEYMKGDEKESSSQDSTKGGFASMSQETGDELNGRFTALQISNEEIKNSMFFVMGNLSSLCTNTSNGNILLTEMRNLAVMSNGHLEDIAKYTKVLLGFGEKLDNIAYNTKSLTVK